jgi:hypothetical protein
MDAKMIAGQNDYSADHRDLVEPRGQPMTSSLQQAMMKRYQAVPAHIDRNNLAINAVGRYSPVRTDSYIPLPPRLNPRLRGVNGPGSATPRKRNRGAPYDHIHRGRASAVSPCRNKASGSITREAEAWRAPAAP